MWSISTRRGLIDDAANPTMRLSVEDVLISPLRRRSKAGRREI
jgi:hypothetical protein